MCCLSSLNLETWFEWKDHPTFIEDVMRFLDNVLQDFIDTRARLRWRRRRYSRDARALASGLGVMGFHSLPAGAERAVRERGREGRGTSGCSSTSASRPTAPRACWPRSAAPARMPPNTASWSASRTRWRSRRRRRSPSSAAAPPRASSRSRRTSTTTRRCRARYIVRNPYLKKVLAKHGRGQRRDLDHRSPSRKGSVQHLDFLTSRRRRSSRPPSSSTSAG